jgi:nucleoside-diphosphate-sugar epimerase
VVGRRVIPLLLRAGHEVTALARSEAQHQALSGQGVLARRGDLFAPGPLREAVVGHDAVINLATHLPPMGARMMLPWAWRENDRIRREGAANLAAAARLGRVERFVQESFALTYADHGDDWIDESWPVRPLRTNRTVLDAEQAARRFTEAGGVGVVLRFAGFYGPDATQLAQMVRLIRHGWGALPGPASSFCSSISHDDAASAVVAALSAPAGIYNVADDEPLRHRDYVDALADAVGVAHPRLPPPWVARVAGPIGHMLARSQRIGNLKLRNSCSWAPRYRSVREGFPPTVAALPNGPGLEPIV